jgi:hypothetical protein
MVSDGRNHGERPATVVEVTKHQEFAEGQQAEGDLPTLTENALASLQRASDPSEVAKARRGNTIIRVLVFDREHRHRAQQVLRDIDP